MINLIYQGFAVLFRTLLIFIFIFYVSKENKESEISVIIALFTYSSIFSNIICFGFDYFFIQNKDNTKLDSFSFFIKILSGVFIVFLIIYLQKLNWLVMFYSISLSLPLIFKGYVRFSKDHKLDFMVNFLSLSFFLALSFLYEIKMSYLTLLSISIFFPFSMVLIWKLEFDKFIINRKVFKSIYLSFPLMVYGLLSYLLLNVDLYVFKYWDKVDMYANYAISNKFFMNITMVPVILGNYRISYVFEKKVSKKSIFREFLILGLILSLLSYVFADFIISLITDNKIFLSNKEKIFFSLIVFLRTINTYYGLMVLKMLSNWLRLYIIVLVLILHLVLLLGFIYYYDWNGAIYAMVLSSSIFILLNYIILKIKSEGSE